MSLQQQAETLKTEAMAALAAADTTQALQDLRVHYLGKKGALTELMKQLGTLSAEERKTAGAALNLVKDDVGAALDARQSALEAAELNARLITEKLDMTLPAQAVMPGRIHPISQTMDEVISIFASMGFVLAEGPDVETDWHNFTALNMPPDHPARQMQDTFYMPGDGATGDGEKIVLRTHTSPVQVRTMQAQKAPLRIICPGRVYRCDSDQTHSPMFHQVEGLVIDEATTMAHLKGCLVDFLRAFFGIPDLPARFRPSYFPFVEPGAEMDIGCARQGGQLKLGNHGDWLEILGCGMVHPDVLKNCGIDPEQYQGFAFGMGIDRIAMLKYGIPDIRSFFEGDTRWLQHYGFAPHLLPNAAFDVRV